MNKILLVIALLLLSSTASVRAKDGTAMATVFQREVHPTLEVPEAEQARYAALLDAALQTASVTLATSQYLVMLDRSPKVQAIFLYWFDADTAHFYFIGATPASSGKPGRFDYFITPLGVFAHTLDNKDFRAEGTFNKNGIRGLGIKGMRSYDFGWAMAERGWGGGGLGQMRLMMHATDPDFLEKYLGVARSKGCVRIPATLNTYIDRYGILDADYDQALSKGEKLWVLRPDRTPTIWPGRYLVIIDSNTPARPDWSPLPASMQPNQKLNQKLVFHEKHESHERKQDQEQVCSAGKN